MDTRTQILDAGEELMKRAGFHGFSYADVAKVVDIKKPSIHHHFPTKAHLARAAVARYREGMASALERAGEVGIASATKALGAIFEAALFGPGANCLCASLAADWETLPAELQHEIRAYWQETTSWLADAVLIDRPSLTAEAAYERARMGFSLFEGAMLTARVEGDVSPLRTAPALATRLLASD